MEAGHNPQPGAQPQPPSGQPHRPLQAMGHRPSVDGFAPRRALQPVAPGGMQPRPTLAHPTTQSIQPTQPAQPRPVAPRPSPAPTTPTSQYIAPAPHPNAMPTPGHHPMMVPVHPAASGLSPAQPAQPQAAAARPVMHGGFTAPRPGTFGSGAVGTSAAPTPAQPTPTVPVTPTAVDDQSHAAPGHPREKNRTGHAGIVGFVVFILLGALLLSPFLPGKIIQDFPLASNTYSTGDSALDCIGTQGKLTTTTSYDTKAGSPITYTYATSTTQKATCDSTEQNATIGHTSQLNPLGLAIDILVAIAVAIIFSRIWRLIFGEKKHRSHTPEL